MKRKAGLVLCLSLGLASAANAQNPVPFVNQPLVPSSAAPGGPVFTLTVNGTGFVPGAAVDWNGTPLPTIFVSTARLTASVSAANVAMAGTASITVVNPETGAASNVLYLPIAEPRQVVAFTYPPNPTSLGLPPENIPDALAPGDFNCDGRVDIALVEGWPPPLKLVVLLGNGDGTFTLLAPSPAPDTGWHGITVGDFNGDGRLDLAMADAENNTVAVLIGNGDGTFQRAPGSPASVGSRPLTVVAADFNGDGKLDVAIVNDGDRTLSILLGNGDGTFTTAPGSPIAPPSGASPLGVVVGDFNHDGKLDLAVSRATDALGINILLGNGDGTFTAAPSSPTPLPETGLGPVALVVADFDGDGKLDLAVASPGAGTIGVLLGSGDGSFAAVPACCGPSRQLLNNHGNLAVGDLRGAGKLDLTLALESVAVPGAQYTTTMEGNGDGTFTPGKFSILQDAFQTNMAIADFNDDGQLDIAMTDPVYAELTILLQAAPPGNGPDFSLDSAGSTSVSIKPGETAYFPLRLNSLNGFIGTVTYTCSGAPKVSTCSFLTYTHDLPEPDDFLFDTSWVLFRASVKTTAPTLTYPASLFPRPAWPPVLPTMLLSLILMLALISTRRASLKTSCLSTAPFAVLLMYVVLWSACGGGSPGPVLKGGTPPGTYTLTVTATSGSITHSTTLTLTVQ